MLRAMFVEFPDDPACDHLDRQYMLGDSLLVAPVFSRNGSVDYYVPAGMWTNLLNGDTVQGPRWMRETYDVMDLPLLVRPNAVLPMSSRNDRPDYDYSDDVILKIFQLGDGKQVLVEIPDLLGNTDAIFHIQREQDIIHIQRQGSQKPWKILLVNIHSIETKQLSKQTSEGVLLSLERSTDSLELKIPAL